MKKTLKFIFIIILLIFNFSCQSGNNTIKKQEENNITLIENGSNIFLFMPGVNINSEMIRYTLENYSYMINSFMQANGFSDKKIENENITFLIVKNSYKELSNIDDETIDKIKNIRKNENFKYLKYYYYTLDSSSYEVAAFYIDKTNMIVINYQKIETKTEFISTILAEYNHCLTYSNVKKYYGNDFYAKIYWAPMYYIDDIITGFYNSIFQILIKNKDILHLNNSDFMITILDIDKYIYDTNANIVSYFRTIEKSVKFVPFKEICIEYLLDWSILLFYYDSFIPYIVNNYGYEYIYSLIKYLYSSKYDSFEQIINDVFSDSSENFIKNWEDRVKIIIKIL